MACEINERDMGRVSQDLDLLIRQLENELSDSGLPDRAATAANAVKSAPPRSTCQRHVLQGWNVSKQRLCPVALPL